MKQKYVAGVAGIAVLSIFICLILSHYQHTSLSRPKDCYAVQMQQFHSTVDADGDGKVELTDILDCALEYVNMYPKYKS